MTKYRKKIFNQDAINRLKVIVTKVSTDFESQLVEVNGEADHIRLLVNYPRKPSVFSLVNSLKGVSSSLLGLNVLTWVLAIGKACSGHPRILLPTVAVRLPASFAITLKNSKRFKDLKQWIIASKVAAI